MSKRSVGLPFIALILLLAACGTAATPVARQALDSASSEIADEEHEATVEPTTVPVTDVLPTEEPTAVPPTEIPLTEESTAAPPTEIPPTVAPAETEEAAAGVSGDRANGQALFTARGCGACHAIDTDITLVGPSLRGIAERAATRVEGLSAIEYIRQSILEPGAFLADGLAPVMPSTFGQTLSEQEIEDLIAYLLTL